MKVFLVFAVSSLVLSSSTAQKGPEIIYPDKEHPSETPRIFAPGFICIPGEHEGALSFSPNGRSLFFTKVIGENRLALMEMKFENGNWTAPKRWEFSTETNDSEAYVSPDGEELYFISTRHAPDEKGSGRIYKSTRDNNTWKTPQHIDMSLRTDKGLWFPTVSLRKTLFFGAYLDSVGNLGKSDIYIYNLRDKNPAIKNAGSIINSPYEEWDPYIAPDESYMLFESDRPGGYGAVDIYVTFKLNGEWKEPINLGPPINTSAYEVAAKVSPDGRFIFFDRPTKNEQDIHWVSANILNKLKLELLAKEKSN
jgi:Tol biopolymer transport system component